MLYINPSGEYPRHVGDIQLEHPGWELGQPLPSGWRQVASVDAPIIQVGEILEELQPREVDGVISQVWSVRPMTEEELAERNAPIIARQKLKDATGLTDYEIDLLIRSVL